MDPSTMMGEGSFPKGGRNGASFNLAEIWQFPLNGGAGAGVGESGLGLRSPQFRHNNLGQFSAEYSGPNRDVSGNDPVSSEQRVNNHVVSAARKRRDSEDESTKAVSPSNGANAANDCNGKRRKASGCNKNEERDNKAESEPSSGKHVEQNTQPHPEPPKDYIHVRARRGQATDSHSLAERARREKISERMKILQDLVPGCNKVIGKALVLDEIINYIQSLQRQVEFLSMKLEAVNARVHTVMQEFPAKDYVPQSFDSSGMPFGSQATRDYSRGSSPEWLHMQIGGGFERAS